MKKFSKIFATALFLAIMMSSTAFAGTWKQDTRGWWWQEDNGQYPKAGWQWIDGNGDGIAESYYFDGDGYVLTSTTTPDGYTVNQDGAWTESGVVKTQTAAAPANVTDGGRGLYEAAALKVSQLSGMDSKAKINMTMSDGEQSMTMAMDMDMKYKDMSTSNMKVLIQTNANVLGQSVNQTSFYTDGFYYVDSNGQKVKMAMNLDQIMANTKSSTAMSSVETSYMKDFQASAGADGSTVVSYNMDSSALMASLNSIYSMLGMNASDMNMNIKSMSGSATIRPDGYFGSNIINMVIDVSAQGQTMNISMNMDMQFINPGQPVDFALPSTEGYQDAASLAQ